MRKSLIFLVAIMFLLIAATSFADDATSTTKPTASGCPMMQSKAGATTDSAKGVCPMMGKASVKAEASSAGDAAVTATGDSKPAGGCPMMNKASEKAEIPSTTAQPAAEVKEAAATTAVSPAVSTSKSTEGACPNVAGQANLTAFHDVLQPMHMAIKDAHYTEVKNSMPKLLEVSKGLANSKCPMSGKCSPDCMKKFDEKKTTLIKAVDDLNLACKGDDNKKIDETFGVMHQAYIDFAGMCNPGAKGAETKAFEVKTKTETK